MYYTKRHTDSRILKIPPPCIENIYLIILGNVSFTVTKLFKKIGESY